MASAASVPSSLNYPWIEEMEKWIPELNPDDINLIDNKTNIRRISTRKVTVLGHGLLTSDAKTLVDALHKQKFQVIVVDESHYLKSRNSACSKSLVPIGLGCFLHILLTGTPALGRTEEEASASFKEWEKLMRALDSGIAGTDNSFVEVMGLIQRMYKQTAIAKAGALKDYITMMLENEKLKFLVFAHHLTMLQACKEAVIEAKGLTFTVATHIVFAELYCNPGHIKQAEDRAHRIGQCSSVHIHYLIAKGTFDTVMWGMLNRKFEKEKQHDIRTFFSPRAGKENKRKRPTEESPAGTPNDEDKAEMTILNQSVEEGTMTKGGSQEIADEEILEIATEPQSKRMRHLSQPMIRNSGKQKRKSWSGKASSPVSLQRSQRVSEGASLLWKKLPAVEREWNCISCTYTNSSLLPYCEVCETRRDSSSNPSKEESQQSNKATSEKEQVPEGLSQTDCLVISDTDSESDSNTRTDPEQTNEMEMEKQKPEKSQCNKSPSQNIEDEESSLSSKATSEKEQVPEGLSQTECLVISDTDSESDSNTRTDPEQTNEMEMEKQKPEKSQYNKSPSENIEDDTFPKRMWCRLHSVRHRKMEEPCELFAKKSRMKVVQQTNEIPDRAEGESVNGTTQSVASSSAMPSQTAADSQEKGYLQALDAEGNPLCICCQLPSLQVNTAWDTRFCSQRCQEEFLVRSNQSYKSQGLRNGIQSLSAVQSPRPRTLPVHQRRSRSQQEGDTGEHLDVTAVFQSGNIPLQRLFISNRIQISRFVSIAKTKTTTIGQMLM
ncbi:UNVERIFIED_CONTAM: hypothetical protein FKN15_021175 [Acipenser sinensis]